MKFSEAVSNGLALLGGREDEPVVDFITDPGGACAALEARKDHEGIVVRAMPELSDGPVGHGQMPRDPVWIRVMRGAEDVGTASFRGQDGATRRVSKVIVEAHDEPCCDAPSCTQTREVATAWLVLEGFGSEKKSERLLITEHRGLPGSRAVVSLVARKLSTALGVETEGTVDTMPELPPALTDTFRSPEGARFVLRGEGHRMVLRDHATNGPRDTAARTGWAGIALAIAAGASWTAFVRSWLAPSGSHEGLPFVALSVLFTFAAATLISIARFAAKYTATSTALVAVSRDQLVVMPWVARDGSVDSRPMGRLGAAIPLADVREAKPVVRGNGVAVEIDTDHGPIDAMVCKGDAIASLWATALNRVLAGARHGH